MSNEITPKAFFQQPSVAELRLLACPGAEELTNLIDRHLVRWGRSGRHPEGELYHPVRVPPLPERRRQGPGEGLGARRRYLYRGRSGQLQRDL